MKPVTRQKLWFALFVAVVFVMGFGSGVATSRFFRFGGPHGRGPGGPGGPGGIPPPPPSAARIAEGMARDLQLTPDQQKQVEQAFERGAERLEKFRTATREQFDVLKKQLDDDIDRVLTPEQRMKHQTMRREEDRRRRPPPGGRGPGPGGPGPGGPGGPDGPGPPGPPPGPPRE
jgi:Spy/CpxP family protein refolding chaperone